MMHPGKNRLAAQRFAERRQREADAPRLRREVPSLASLRLEIEECAGAGATRHRRHVVIDQAPALFLVPCGDPRCVDGGHDITWTVMVALRARQAHLEGKDECTGSIGSSTCSRVIHFEGAAAYAA